MFFRSCYTSTWGPDVQPLQLRESWLRGARPLFYMEKKMMATHNKHEGSCVITAGKTEVLFTQTQLR